MAPMDKPVVKPPTPTSDLGSRRRSHGLQRGFTLLELLIVLALLAVAVATVSLSVRDPEATALEREGERLCTLLETARAEARASAVPARWQPRPPNAETGGDFRFVGLPDTLNLPTHWLNPEVRVEIYGAGALTLGPEPMIGPQRVTLMLGERRISLSTDGLQPFTIESEVPGAP